MRCSAVALTQSPVNPQPKHRTPHAQTILSVSSIKKSRYTHHGHRKCISTDYSLPIHTTLAREIAGERHVKRCDLQREGIRRTCPYDKTYPLYGLDQLPITKNNSDISRTSTTFGRNVDEPRSRGVSGRFHESPLSIASADQK